jgi:MFS family permease
MALHNFSDLTCQTAFMRLWYSRLASISGQQMLMVAVGWQMYELTGSAWDLGLVGLFQFLPALLLTLVAGHVADRLHRARIVLVCLLVQGLVALVLMAATEGLFAGGPWASRELLLGLSVALGAARAFQMPAQQALMPHSCRRTCSRVPWLLAPAACRLP